MINLRSLNIHDYAKILTFKDLEFINDSICNNLRARIKFNNSYSISVLFGTSYYSNGIDTYEIAILYKGRLTNDKILFNNDLVEGYVNVDRINYIMKEVQKR